FARWGREKEEARNDAPREGFPPWPDLALLDGGKGQLAAALEVAGELRLEGIAFAAVAKGPERNAGRETFHLPGGATLTLDGRDSLLYYLQRLRDEAHRFAIGAHRARRRRAARDNPLDAIAGIGPKKKKALLAAFGSAKAVARADVRELLQVEGISARLARAIHDHFHQA
ncbi:MAG TPA: excinuclease ABC subunit C, partial [Thermopetrobacter sp.]|nr:excinuclease ABC subunit C [Thermopetrobacter sp.]